MKTMAVEVLVDASSDPTTRVLAMETVAREYCKSAGLDPAEAVMMLLCAATVIHQRFAKQPSAVADGMSDALGNAIIAATQIKGLRNARP